MITKSLAGKQLSPGARTCSARLFAVTKSRKVLVSQLSLMNMAKVDRRRSAALCSASVFTRLDTYASTRLRWPYCNGGGCRCCRCCKLCNGVPG